jgi:hypothetical protein
MEPLQLMVFPAEEAAVPNVTLTLVKSLEEYNNVHIKPVTCAPEEV